MSTGNNPLLPKLTPIMMKERVSLVFVEKGNLDVLDGAFVVVDVNGVRTHIPVGGVSCLMLEPGTRVSHAAVSMRIRQPTARQRWRLCLSRNGRRRHRPSAARP